MLEIMAVKLVAPVPPVFADAVVAPSTTASTLALLSVAVLPTMVIPASNQSMVACISPPLAASIPDSAANAAPYLTAAVIAAGVKAALAEPFTSTVVTTLLPIRSANPKAPATAALV